jgi:hypothetical protein
VCDARESAGRRPSTSINRFLIEVARQSDNSSARCPACRHRHGLDQSGERAVGGWLKQAT